MKSGAAQRRGPMVRQEPYDIELCYFRWKGYIVRYIAVTVYKNGNPERLFIYRIADKDFAGDMPLGQLKSGNSNTFKDAIYKLPCNQWAVIIREEAKA